jgi:hypothetical protein
MHADKAAVILHRHAQYLVCQKVWNLQKYKFMTRDSHMTMKCALQGLWSVFQNVQRTFCDHTIEFKLSHQIPKKQGHFLGAKNSPIIKTPPPPPPIMEPAC